MLRIFVADDDLIIREGIKVMLKKANAGYEVVGEAADGEIALEGIKNSNPDLLITDVKMPIMDGIELVKKIKEFGMKFKIIVLSGFDEYRYVREGFKYGAVDYILKPIKKQEFLKLLQKIESDIQNERNKNIKEKLLKDKANAGFDLLKEKCLLKLIENDKQVNYELESKVKEAGMSINGGFVLLSIGIDNLVNRKASLEILNSQISECIKKFKNRFIQVIKNSNIIILFWDNKEKSELMQMLKDIQTELNKKNKFTFSLGISKRFDVVYKCNIAYKQATSALSQRFYIGSSSLIEYDENYYSDTDINLNIINEYLEESQNSMEICDSNRIRISLEKFFQYIKEQKINCGKAKLICQDFISKIKANCDEFGQYVDEHYVNDEFELNFYINEISIFTELREYIINLFCDITENIKTVKEEREKKVIEKAKKYILNHYKENITLSMVADNVFLNPSYFSALFKNESGKNFVDFLTDVRINEAKKLLASPEIKIYEIGQRVGYDEVVSFGRAFKKKVGISPTEYRKLIK